MLRNLFDRLTYLRNLEDKKQTVLASIEEQGKLTDELKKAILEAQTQVAVDDLYRPYRPKRRTRATIAKEKGLEPLAQTILAQESSVDIMAEAAKYVDAEKTWQMKQLHLPEQRISLQRTYPTMPVTEQNQRAYHAKGASYIDSQGSKGRVCL